MFFDVTRAGTDRTLRVAVAAIAYLDVLPVGSVLHLVGGQSLQVCQTAAEIEERAIAAHPIAAIQSGDKRIEHAGPGLCRLKDVQNHIHHAVGGSPIVALQPGEPIQMAIRIAQVAGTGTRAETDTDTGATGVDWTEVLGSGLGEPSTLLAEPTIDPAPTIAPTPAPKSRRRRGKPA